MALDLDVVETIIAPLRTVTPATLFGKGKIEEFEAICEVEKIDVAVFDDQLTPVQQRNLERSLNVKVVDRTGLILEIFARRARTREGKLQVELARLQSARASSAPGPTLNGSAAAPATPVVPARPRSSSIDA